RLLNSNLSSPGLDLAYAADGRTVATIEQTGVPRLWDASTVGEIWQGKPLEKLSPEGLRQCSVAFSPDNRLVATGQGDGMVHLWEVATGQEAFRFNGHKRIVHEVVFSADGRRLLSCSGHKFYNNDGTAIVWDMTQGPYDPYVFGARYGKKQLQELW